MPTTPCKLTQEVHERIVEVLRAGNFRDVAARTAGVSPRSLKRWFALGRDKPRTRYGRLRMAMFEAEQAAEADQVRAVLLAAPKDWKAAAWWLERKHPEKWGRRDPQRLEVTGKNGGPIETEMLHGLTDAERAARIAAILDEARAREALPAPGSEAALVSPPRPADAGTPEPG